MSFTTSLQVLWYHLKSSPLGLALWVVRWCILAIALSATSSCARTTGLQRMYVVPGMTNAFHSAQPKTWEEWFEVERTLCHGRNPCRVHVAKLDRESEGSEGFARARGWDVRDLEIHPYTDAFPWVQEIFYSVPAKRARAIRAFLAEIPPADNWVDVYWWHCVHGEDRTERVTWEYLYRFRGWTWESARAYAEDLGFHWWYYRLARAWP